jgi:hypothetical protein
LLRSLLLRFAESLSGRENAEFDKRDNRQAASAHKRL